MVSPNRLRKEHIISAWLTVISPLGSGLEDVLVINASLLLSIIWLKPFDEPTTKNPPMIRSKNVVSENTSKAIKYEQTDEKTTLKDSLCFIKIRVWENKDDCFIFKVSDINLCLGNILYWSLNVIGILNGTLTALPLCLPGVILGNLAIILWASSSRFLSGPLILMLVIDPSLSIIKFT